MNRAMLSGKGLLALALGVLIAATAAAASREESHAVVLLRGLPTLDTKHSVAIVELDPESDDFGRIVFELIERGEKDRDNPDISVKIITDHELDGRPTHLIQIKRKKPSNEDDDFSLAEIILDPERQLILCYRAFGWPDEPDGKPILRESYTYHDVKTNVGLTDADFDPKNPEYNFPAL